jgi:hypothetical protein
MPFYKVRGHVSAVFYETVSHDDELFIDAIVEADNEGLAREAALKDVEQESIYWSDCDLEFSHLEDESNVRVRPLEDDELAESMANKARDEALAQMRVHGVGSLFDAMEAA